MFGQKDGAYQLVTSNPLVHNDPTGLCKVRNFNINEFDKQCKYYPRDTGGSYGYRFSVTTEFRKPCACCEFRQYITCGTRVRRFLGGRWDNWWQVRQYGELHEDCYEQNGRRWCYGDRTQPPRSFDRYVENGCIYQHIDQPGLNDIKALFEGAPANLKYEIDMHCRVLMNVIDTTNQQVVWSQILDFSCHDIIDREGVVDEAR